MRVPASTDENANLYLLGRLHQGGFPFAQGFFPIARGREGRRGKSPPTPPTPKPATAQRCQSGSHHHRSLPPHHPPAQSREMFGFGSRDSSAFHAGKGVPAPLPRFPPSEFGMGKKTLDFPPPPHNRPRPDEGGGENPHEYRILPDSFFSRFFPFSTNAESPVTLFPPALPPSFLR